MEKGFRHIVLVFLLCVMPQMNVHAQFGAIIDGIETIAGKVAGEKVTPSETWWGKILEEVETDVQTLDGVLTLGDQLSKQGDLLSALYTGTRYFESTQKMANFIAECENTKRIYRNYIDFFTTQAKNGIGDYHDVTRMITQGSYFMNIILDDVKSLTDLMGLSMTNKERDDKINEAIEKQKARQQQLQNQIDAWVTEKQQSIFSSVLSGLTGGRAKKVDKIGSDNLEGRVENAVGEKISYIAEMSQKDWNDKMEKEFNKNEYRINEKPIEEAAKSIREARKPAIRFTQILIILLSALYVPYNLWRSRTGERQSTDALFRIFLGLVVGFTSTVFLEAILKF